VTDKDEKPNEAEPKQSAADELKSMPLWKKGLLGVSVVLMLLGGALYALPAASGTAEPKPLQGPVGVVETPDDSGTDLQAPSGLTGESGAVPPNLTKGLTGESGGFNLPDFVKNLPSGETPDISDVPGDAPPATPDYRDASADGATGDAAWQGAVFRFGFSFFAGFAIGFALRAFLKITMLVAGVILLAIFGLEYAGIVSVNWADMASGFDGVTAWLEAQTSSFYDFIVGQLPSGASAAGGLVVGFRK